VNGKANEGTQMLQIIEKEVTDSSDGYQFNQLIKFDNELSGYTDEHDEFHPSIYGVQITTEEGGHGDFIGVYDLDGEQLNLPNPGSWELVEGEDIKDVPQVVLNAFNWD
jgi:hypothetical protein